MAVPPEVISAYVASGLGFAGSLTVAIISVLANRSIAKRAVQATYDERLWEKRAVLYEELMMERVEDMFEAAPFLEPEALGWDTEHLLRRAPTRATAWDGVDYTRRKAQIQLWAETGVEVAYSRTAIADDHLVAAHRALSEAGGVSADSQTQEAFRAAVRDSAGAYLTLIDALRNAVGSNRPPESHRRAR
jgi:hypothetical protein